MAMNELVRFCTDYLPNHPELKRTIDGRRADRFAALAAAGRKAGFDFSEDEVRTVVTDPATVELSDAQLKGIAGGVTNRKAGGGQQEYLKVTLEDVFISSY
jgi:hypothetical protein